MKILQINAVNEYSSTGRTTAELHAFLQNEGVDSYVAAINIERPSNHMIKIGGKVSRYMHSFLSHLTGMQGCFSFFATKKLIKEIDHISPDVIHLRNLHSNFINLPLLLGFIAHKNIPTVLTLHDFWFLTGHCCYFTDANCNKFQSGCGNCPDLNNWNKSWFFDFTRHNLALKRKLFGSIKILAVIGVSDWVINYVRTSILKDATIIKTIYNWVDTSVFCPRSVTSVESLRNKYNIGKDEFVILGVAQNWTVQKGLNEFVELARITDAKIVLVGNPAQEMDAFPQNIIFAGVTASVDELATFYSMADVFFNPTTRETFGKVTIEAQACGTPVIAYNATATPELISEGCGFVLNERDLSEVNKCVEIIKREGKSKYVNNCRRSIVEHFDKQLLMKKYLNLYKELQYERK